LQPFRTTPSSNESATSCRCRREAVRERGLAALVRPTPGIEVERYLEVLFHDRQADTIAAQETEIERLRGLVTRCAEAGVDPDPTDDAVPGLVAARVDELTRATSGDELRRLLQAVVASRARQTLEKVAPALHRQILEAIDPGGEGGEDPARPGASRWQDAPPGSVVEVDGFLVVR